MGSSRENRIKRREAAKAVRHAERKIAKSRSDRLIFITVLSVLLLLAIAVTVIVAVKNRKDDDGDGKSTAATSANIFTRGSLVYAKTEDGDLSVYIFDGDDTSVEIPAYADGKAVIQIGSCAFLNERKITSVKVGENVKYIEEEVFSGCTSLSEITLYNTLESIGADAFKGCTSLTKVIFYGTQEEFRQTKGIDQLTGIAGLTVEYRERTSGV